MTQTRQRMLVIGGGIVGTCCALSLQRAGHAVVMIDPAEPGDSTAKWSCGQISVGEIIPLSKPAIIQAAPGWLMDQTGPLAMRVGALPGILPWFLRFASNARKPRIHEISAALASLTRHVFADYAPLIEAAGDSRLIGQRPVLHLFGSAEAVAREHAYIARRRELGFASEPVGAAEIAELEPALAGRFQHGLLLPQWRFVSDTEGFIQAMTRCFEAAGGQRVRGDVHQILEDGGRASGVRLSGGATFSADQLVLAAGAGARRFFRQLGLNVPLQGVAGYQALLPDPGVDIRHSVIHAQGGFCFTPMSRGLQIGGTIEFAGHDAEPNFKRAEIILAKAKALLPQLNTRGVEFGVGHRPLLPDTKPIIDRCRRLPNVLLAVGHGQLGLTLGATTGRLITELATHGGATQDISAFSAYRY
ncbi:NAD(P)/FAD-dependent oxidoreductase [Pseudaquabacterium rugosum]|uniref:FAD-dependent oxidoreductase n=1 Tax=Pseudaquabacterium rugosum TaxID=2984194 RepID=A0ABU9B844_9BURK